MPSAGNSTDNGAPVHAKFTQTTEEPSSKVAQAANAGSADNRSPPRTTREISASDRPTRDDPGAGKLQGIPESRDQTDATPASDRGHSSSRRRTDDATSGEASHQQRREAPSSNPKRTRESSSSSSSPGRNEKKYSKSTTADDSRSSPTRGPGPAPSDERHHNRQLVVKEPVHLSTKESEDGVLVLKDEGNRTATLDRGKEVKEVAGEGQTSSIPTQATSTSASPISYTVATSGAKQQVPSQPYPPRPTQSSSASTQTAEHSQSQRGQPTGGTEMPNQRSSNSGGGYLNKITGGLLSSGPPRDRGREDVTRLKLELQRAEEELRRSQADLRSARHACNEIHNERMRLRETCGTLQNEMKNVQRELDDYRTLSEVRGKELLGAQVFLTKADLLSVSEIVQKVSDLNDENFQAAAMVSEAVIHHKAVWNSDEERQDAVRKAEEAVGEAMLRTLIANADEAVPNLMLVQLVIQMCLARFCCAKIVRWYEGEGKTDLFLSKIYNEIRDNEEQAVTGRWRAITHKYTRLSVNNWVKEFTSGLGTVLRLAGWNSTAQHRSAFENNLKPIFKAVLDLRIALGEQFTSADIEPFIVQHDIAFDPRHMEDALDDARASKTSKKNGAVQDSEGPQAEGDVGGPVDIVLGTTGIGLKEWVPRGARNGTEDSYKTTLPPKVILQSTLHELLAPPPPRKKSASSRGAK